MQQMNITLKREASFSSPSKKSNVKKTHLLLRRGSGLSETIPYYHGKQLQSLSAKVRFNYFINSSNLRVPPTHVCCLHFLSLQKFQRKNYHTAAPNFSVLWLFDTSSPANTSKSNNVIFLLTFKICCEIFLQISPVSLIPHNIQKTFLCQSAAEEMGGSKL